MQVFGGLDLQHRFVVDDHVESLMRDVGAVVLNEDVHLPVDAMSPMEQLALERGRVNVLEKAETQSSVYREKCADH